ncbi:MAG TPA: MarR family transcriptional regulator [Aggregatilineales bacterium]|nr:MarR family transcriptional regulator [Aggregatilineales bacterium]
MSETYQPDLMQLLISAGRAMTTLLDEKLLALELSAAKFYTLQILTQANEMLPLSELAERLGTGKSNMTPLVDRLEADRLVRRLRSDADRRVVYVEITAEGISRLQHARVVFAETSHLLEGQYTAEELHSLTDLLGRFVMCFCPPH